MEANIRISGRDESPHPRRRAPSKPKPKRARKKPPPKKP
jgi:hypothetical protein